MSNSIFMSYSRRELGFVDDLVSDLEDRKYHVWLDYRVLIPGSPWAEQIAKGLKDADTAIGVSKPPQTVKATREDVARLLKV